MKTSFLAALLLLLLISTATATVVVRVGVDEMTDLATVVVRGEVLEVKSRWTEDGRTINTYVRLRVDRVLKGTAGGEITACCPGGRVGEERIPVAGIPEFAKGEKVVVFLWKNKRGDYLPLGLNQGKFRIEKNSKTGEETAKNSLAGLAFVAPPDGKGGKKRIKRTPDQYRLADLEKKVRDRVELKRREAEEARRKAKEEEEAKKREEEKKAKEPSVKKGEEKPEPPARKPAKPERPVKKKRPGEESSPDRR